MKFFATMTSIIVLFCMLIGAGASAQSMRPELMYFRFDQTGATVDNLADPATRVGATGTIMGALSQGSTGQWGGALIGTGGSSSSNYFDPGWSANLGSSSWTVSFWLGNTPSTTTLYYLMGDAGASSWRAFIGGVAGQNNIIMRGPISDITITNITGGPCVVTFVYDNVAGQMRGYKNGVLAVSQSQSTVNINGSGFKIGGYSSSTGMPTGMLMDEFRMYSRALTTAEIAASWDQEVLTPPSPNDAGVSSIDSPLNFCAGVHPVTVTLENFGINQITSATVNWTVNGVPQTSYNWTGLLDTLTPASRKASVTLGSMTFLNGVPYTIRAWSTMPNGVPDTVNINDTTTVTRQAALAGTFTIGGTNPDFATVEDAVDALKDYGVCAPVTFDVRPGLYIGKITVPAITGASSSNTITFLGSGAGNTIVQYQTSSSYDYVWCLDGADYVRIRNLTIRAVGQSYGTGILLTGAADHNEITGCHVWVDPTTTSSNFAGILASTKTSMGGSGDNANYNLIQGNTVTGGYYGIRFYGPGSTDPAMGNEVIDNVVQSFYYYGVTMYYQGSAKVNGNKIMDRKGTTSSYGMYLYYNHIAPEVVGNHIEAGYYGIRVYYSNRDSTVRGKIVNNMITTWGTSTNYGIYVYRSHKFDIWNNSVNMLTGSTGYGIRVSSYSTYRNQYVDLRNNTVRKNTGGTFYAYYLDPYIDPLAYLAISNNNAYRSSGTIYWRAGSTSHSSVSSAQSSNPGYFQNCYTYDPQYFGNYDLHSKSTAMNNLGAPISWVTDDYDNEGRSATTPDIGADEYTPPALDIAVTDIVLPATGCGLTSTESIGVILKNNGTNTIDASVNPVPVQILVTGAVIQTITGTLSSGTIAPNASTTFTVGTLNMTTVGTYVFNATASMVGDQVPHNNTYGPVSMQTDENITLFPYAENFEASNGGWKAVTIHGVYNSWEWGVPNHIGTASGSVLINTANSGQKVWMTGLESGYFDDELSAVESPCFDFTSLSAPVLKFWMNINTESTFDGVQVEASTDGGAHWTKISPYEPAYWESTSNGPLPAPWYSGTSVNGWNRYVFELGTYAGKSNMKFRIVMGSDGSVEATGVAIDDVEIGDFNKFDYTVTHVQYNNAQNYWARIIGLPHIVEATIKNAGYAANPTTVPAVYKEGSNPTGPTDGVAETLPITWSGEKGVIQFTTPHVPTHEGIMPFFVRLFEPTDVNPGNDFNMTLPNVQNDKTLGYEDFEILSPPNWEKGFTVQNLNGGPTWELQPSSGVGGTLAATYPGSSSPADDWFISPAAAVEPGGSYCVALKYRSFNGDPQTISIAYGESPNPATMTVLATYSGFTNTSFIDAVNQDGVAPWFNVPITANPHYIGIHVSSAGNSGPVDIDNIRFYENPTPPPIIEYGNDPVWVSDPSIPINLTAVYKKSGLITRTYTVRNGTGLYGVPDGDMLWDVTTSTDWINIVKSVPDPLFFLTSNPFNPPWCRQFQTFTMEVNASNLVPGKYTGDLDFDAWLYNDDYPNGLHASNLPFVVDVNLTVASAGGTGQPEVAQRTHTGMDASGNPWLFTDSESNVFATVWVQAGTIPSMTINSYPSQLPSHLSRFRYVNHYWTIDADGTGWMADIQFHYFDTELMSHFVIDETKLRGMRLAPGTSFWEDPIAGTASIPNEVENYVLVEGFTPSNFAGEIALAHEWLAPIGFKDAGNIPSSYVVDQNYPNPFNPTTEIRFGIPSEEYVTLAVMNSLGEEVARLVENNLEAGYHRITFDATGLPAGMYFYTLKAGSFTSTKSMILNK